jgi:predicted anti-sigma-YlaC factor YlaD
VSEHLSAQHIQRFRERSLPPAELLAADDHLAACEACRQLLTQDEQAQAAITSLRAELQTAAISESDHLVYEQLAAYLNGGLDELDLEIVESHFAVCSACVEEAKELRAYKAEMSTYSETEYLPTKSLSLKERLATVWRLPAFSIPIQITAIALLALLCVWIATIPLRNQVADLTAQIGELHRLNQELSAQVSEVGELQARLTGLEQSQVQLLNSSPQIASALYDGGGLVTLDKQGNITGLETLPSTLQQTIKVALTSERVRTPPEVREIQGKAGTLLGEGSEGVPFPLISPVGIIIETERPTLRWRSLSGATVYTVTIYDSNFNLLAKSPELRGTEWTVPRPLERGRIYAWQVSALKDGQEVKSPTPPAPEAKFKILEKSRADELEQAKKEYAKSHLTLGVLYCEAGLLEDAEREFKALVAANPKSPTARKLLNNVERLRRSQS